MALAGHKIAQAGLVGKALDPGYIPLSEILPASFKAGIGLRSSNAHNGSAKYQKLGDCTAQRVTDAGCRAGNGVRTIEKHFVQGMGWENP